MTGTGGEGVRSLYLTMNYDHYYDVTKVKHCMCMSKNLNSRSSGMVYKL